MKSAKLTLLISLLIVSSLLLFSIPAAAQQIKISHAAAPGTPRDQAAQVVKSYIEDNLEGVKAEVYPTSQLGSGREQIESLQAGAIEMVILPSAFLGGFEPKMTLLDIPFFLPQEFDKLVELQNSDAAQALLDTTTEEGILSLAFWQTGYKQWTANKKIRTPEDFKGLKYRIMPSPIIEEFYKLIGARPVVIPFSETYSALQTGAADGQGSCPIPLIYDMRFHEVQDYINISNYGPLENVVMVSEIWFNSLTKEQQKIIEEAVAEGSKVCADAAEKEVRVKGQKIQDDGTELIELTDKEIKEFSNVTEDVKNYYIEEYGAEAEELIEIYEKAME